MSGFNGPRAADALALQQLISDYCSELDSNGGLYAHRFFTDDGSLEVGRMVVRGHGEMQDFYRNFLAQVKASESTGVRTSRHVYTNLRIALEDADHAVLQFIVMNFSSGGPPPIQGATSPTVISDVQCKCRRETGGDWKIREFTGVPVFFGDDPLQQKTLAG